MKCQNNIFGHQFYSGSLGELGFDPDKNTPKLILVSKEAQFYTDLQKKILGQKKLQNFW